MIIAFAGLGNCIGRTQALNPGLSVIYHPGNRLNVTDVSSFSKIQENFPGVSLDAIIQ